jgi:hypothetical protein
LHRFSRHLIDRFTCVALVLSIAGVDSPARARGREPIKPDPFTSATLALSGHRSEKVRTQAALVLGRTLDPRAIPFLILALGDPSPVVRAMAAQALGDSGDDSASAPLATATQDSSPLVRRHAVVALQAIRERQAATSIDVKPMGDRTRKASAELRQHMRRFVAWELKGWRKHAPGGYAVDGVIKTLSMSERSDLVEVKCAVQLVLSTGSGKAIVMMSSGEASVQRQKRQFRPVTQRAMELDALENAVRGASDELRQHFAANGP